MAEESGQEKTEQPTPKRLKEAREKGQIPRSRELNTMMLLLAASGGMLIMGPRLMGGLGEMLTEALTLDRAVIFEPAAMTRLFATHVIQAIGLLTPFAGLMILVAILAPLLLGGWTFSPKAAAPKLERIDPLKGIKRVFSSRGLMELLKALGKFAMVASVAILLLWQLADDLVGLSGEPVRQALAHAGQLLGWSFLALSAAMVLVAAIDVPFQIWYHNKQLRMTRQEVRDELKETEGKPEVRGRQRERQREFSRRRMLAEVPKADVVVTNPTHYAVALRYRPERHGAPVVVAKGADLLAAQIRGVAEEHGVALMEAPPLARALYHSTDLDQEIPAGLYVAVAQVLAYVYQLERVRQDGGDSPDAPEDLPIPEEYQH